jgi:hypothetical protein
MPSWPSADAFSRLCGGRLLRVRLSLRVGGWLVFFLFALAAVSVTAQQNPAKDPLAYRSNELTLAGLRPGRDTISKAKKLYDGPWLKTTPDDPNSVVVRGDCTGALLRLEADKSGVIQQIVLVEKNAAEAEKHQVIAVCADLSGSQPLSTTPVVKRTLRWITGHKISIGSTVSALHAAYGEPGNKSPSTRDGQPLELWYYAFDWAGPDVPQVMEVLCTRGQDGQPGRVIEITLAAPSL